MSKTYNARQATTAQSEYCKRTGAPHFAPGNGICWQCRRNIYEKVVWKMTNLAGKEIEVETGITVEKAGKSLVTGCPHCHRSYCD